MIPQEAIRDHADSILGLASRFQSQLSREVDLVIADISATAVASLRRFGGMVDQSPKNSKKVVSIAAQFDRAIERSNYYPTVVAFVSKLSDQIGEFEKLYSIMRPSLGLPPMSLSDGDMEVLRNQAAASMAALDGRVLRARANLTHFLTKSLGELRATQLVRGVSDIIRKASLVEPIARDQAYSFFRTVGSLVYSKLESSGMVLLYSYVGVTAEGTRNFCKGLVEGDRRFLRREIDDMENGQVPGVFHNAGGWGCQHWWAGTRLATWSR